MTFQVSTLKHSSAWLGAKSACAAGSMPFCFNVCCKLGSAEFVVNLGWGHLAGWFFACTFPGRILQSPTHVRGLGCACCPIFFWTIGIKFVILRLSGCEVSGCAEDVTLTTVSTVGCWDAATFLAASVTLWGDFIQFDNLSSSYLLGFCWCWNICSFQVFCRFAGFKVWFGWRVEGYWPAYAECQSWPMATLP